MDVYSSIEQAKQEAWEALSEAQSLEGRGRAVEAIVRCHFERSRLGYRGKHPGFPRYAAAYSNPTLKHRDPQAWAWFVARWGRMASARLHEGYTQWGLHSPEA